MRVLVARGSRDRLLPVWERSRRLPVHEGFKDKAVAMKSKAKLRLLASLSRSHVTIAISLDI